MSASDNKTPSLITPLSKRLRRWLAEIEPKQPEAKIRPSLETDLADAFELTGQAGVEPGLVIFLIASCSWWFRVFYAKKAELKKTLKRQLTPDGYTPHFPRSFNEMSILDRYVTKQLAKQWPLDPSFDGETSGVINAAFQSKCLEEINLLAKQWSGPFLVSECTQLPPRPGGYTQWGPWVAAVAVHRIAIRRRRSKKDSLPLECAEIILKALRGTDAPDRTRLYQCERVIASPRHQLLDGLVSAYERAKKMVVQNESIEPFIDEDCFPSLMATGGERLLLGKWPKQNPKTLQP